MQKKVLIIGIIILALFITSCSVPSDLSFLSFGSSQTSTGKGVKLEFVDYPKGELTDNEQFRIKAMVTNYGQIPIDGSLCLYDTPTDRLGGIPPQQCRPIHLDKAEEISDGKSAPSQQEYYFPDSDAGFFSYHSIPTDIPASSIIYADFTYAVFDKASAQVCVKSMQADQKNIPVPCDDTQTITKINQGDLPVKVSKVEKQSSPLGSNQALLKLKVYIQKDEEGDIVPPENYQDQRFALPMVDFKLSMGGNAFTCSPLKNGAFELSQSEKVINCQATINLGQDYVYDTLVIELGYGFRKTISLPEIKLVSSQVNIA